MHYKLKHYVEFHSPGTFFDESSRRDIDSWDTKKAVEMSKDISERYGAKPYGFSFSTYKVHADVPDGEGGHFEVKPKLEKKSGIYFLGGNLETYDEVVKRNDSKENILRDNMYYNGMWIVCVNTNSYRSIHPFTENDKMVDELGVVIEDGAAAKHVKYREKKSDTRKAKEGW